MHDKKPSPYREPQPQRSPRQLTTAASFALLTGIAALLLWRVFTHPHQMLWANDIVRAHSTYKQVQWQSLWLWKSFPLWDATVFCGKSIVGDPLPAVLNMPSMIFWFAPTPSLFGFFFWLVASLGAWGTYLFARESDCEPLGAVFVAIAFALGGKTAAHVFAGHVELLSTLLGLPWTLWAVERLCRRPTLHGSVLIGAILTIVATFGSVQIVYLNLLFTLAYFSVRLLPSLLEKDWKRALRLCLCFGSGIAVFVAAAAAWWFPIVRQTLLLSARSKGVDFEFATMNSLAYRDLLRFVWPFEGIPTPQVLQPDAANGFYWETCAYPGVVTICLALAAMFTLKNRRDVLTYGSLGLLAILLALGKHSPFYWLAFHVIPGFSLFRAPGRCLFYANFALAMLAGRVISQSVEDTNKRWVTPLILCLSVEVALMLPMVVHPPHFAPSAGMWTPLLVTALLVPFSILWSLRGLSDHLWRIACVAVLALEMLLFWELNIHTVSQGEALPELSAAKFLEEKHQEEEFRVFDPTMLLEQQIAARHGLETITGYHPGIYAHHLDLYKQLWVEDDSDLVELRMHSPREASCPVILDLMNVKYVLAYEPYLGSEYEQVFTVPAHESPQTRYIYRRDSALPRAFLVAKAETPREGISLLDALCTVDPHEVCLVEDTPFTGTAPFQALSVERRSPGDMTMRFATDQPGVVVVSQSWHPDWRATERGVDLQVRRVNHGQVGIPVQPGTHEIRLWYYPWDFYLGCAISGISWVLIFLALAASALKARPQVSTVSHA